MDIEMTRSQRQVWNKICQLSRPEGYPQHHDNTETISDYLSVDITYISAKVFPPGSNDLVDVGAVWANDVFVGSNVGDVLYPTRSGLLAALSQLVWVS